LREHLKFASAAIRARMDNRQAIPERNVVRADIIMAPLDFITEIIQANH
jgi:hypothetical protein